MTQEVAFAATAMRRLALKAGTGSLSAEVVQGGTTKVKTTKAVSSVPVNTQDGDIKVTNTTDGTIFATLITSVRPEFGDRVEARSNGLTLKVSYSAESGRTLNPHDIPQGTDFTAAITVGNTSGSKDYTNLALTGMIPSGWEIVNDRLSGGEASTAAYSYRDIRDDRVSWFFDLPKGSSKTFRIKLHASYQGEFILPAIKCEAMYDPHIAANTASGKAKVSE